MDLTAVMKDGQTLLHMSCVGNSHKCVDILVNYLSSQLKKEKSDDNAKFLSWVDKTTESSEGFTAL
jgi:hypothetical protein